MNTAEVDLNEIVWQPSEDLIASSNLTTFLRRHDLPDYDALVSRADGDPEWFWSAVMDFFDFRFATPCSQILDVSRGIPWARWCVGGTGNVVMNCLDRRIEAGEGAREAVVWEAETGERRSWSYDELNRETCRLASGLSSLGIGRGDVVAIYMPMLPEIVAGYLAIAKLGAIVLPLFSGFGAGAVASRLNDGGAKAVLTVDGTLRRGRPMAMKPVLDEAAVSAPGLRHVVVLRDKGLDLPMTEGRDHDWKSLTGAAPDNVPTTIVGADDPLMIIFTSGTTGKAKGTVHTHYGFSTKLACDLGLGHDFKAGDRLLWMSDMGWLVGPIVVVGTTILGGTAILAEGTPDYPEPGRIWRLAQDHRATTLGIAPTIVRSLMRHGEDEVARYDLSSLRVTVSTGEPWNPDAWMWFFNHVCQRRIPLLNYSGGTEVGGGIISGTVLHPLKPCSFAGPMPGMGADVVDESGQSVPRGQVGELVMRVPSIGLSRGLWNDPDRYIDAYWHRWPDIWIQGDWASVDEDGMWYIHGRSDDTIKVAGKRTGPAEVEALLLATGVLEEAAAVGVPDPVKGEAVLCVCIPKPDARADDVLAKTLSDAVVEGLGGPFRPRDVVFADDLPKTRNMKIMRRVIRAIYTGNEPGDLSSLVNPEAVDGLKQRLEASAAP